MFKNNWRVLFDYPKTKKKYSISVLVPALNEEDTIEDTIRTIFESEYFIKEVIVLNDGSIDNTYNIIREYLQKKDIVYLLRKGLNNKGIPIRRHEAIQTARGEFIAIQDGDDISFPSKSFS